MNTLLVLSITALITQVFAPRPQQQWGAPKKQWEPPEQQWDFPQQNQGGRPPQPQWGPSQSEPSAEWYPRPENQCKCIPKNAKTTAITPIVEVSVVDSSVYPCDTTSTIKEILYQRTLNDNITCNGVVVYTNDDTYDLVYAEPSYGNGQQKETAKITNYTLIFSFNNGNLNYIECGTIANGKCAGDTISGVGIYQANEQNGCCKGGNTGVVGIDRIIEIKGKCQSRCSLGRSSLKYAQPVSNKGFAVRALQSQETTSKVE